ncbi:hypothetical protein BDV26DRAFT_305203 [Aspergillus bertholletiae]|uniref:Ankyrin repeat-containing domain protein n=1 Tax=Aspergillus bertholletiae TaxID=1226010 RepID=A0A5N7B4C7_9EURO|nr:hypothetical protein BDV26DRAFT_305203 [Aspergillus bertholletiae]
MPDWWRKFRRSKKTQSEKDNSLNEEGKKSSQSLVPKQGAPVAPILQPTDLWIRAEQQLRQNSELDKALTESHRILKSEYGLTLQPGDTSHHKRLLGMLEERKWSIQLGDHKFSVKEQLIKVSKNVLAIKDILTPAASASPPAALACAGLTACFTIIVQAAEQHTLLLQGLESSTGLILRLRVMEELYPNPQTKLATDLHGEFQRTLVSIYSKILEFQARAVCYVHRHSAPQFLRDTFRRDGWDGMQQDFERLEKSLDRFTALIGHVEFNRKFENILNTAQEQEKFLNLLYTCQYKDRKDRNGKRVPGTCQWFTNHPIFKGWQQNTNDNTPGLLWVSADPGCGKSVLTRYLVDKLLLNTADRTVCYFFFKDDFEDQKSATKALSVLLRQLFISQPHLLQDTILDKLETDGDKLVQSFSELWDILRSASVNPRAGEIICILDALDECQDGDRKQLTNAVKEFYLGPYKNRKLKFLITSRPYDHIRRDFWELENKLPTIHLSGDGEEEVKDISREISLVIKKRVEVISDQRSLELDERDMLTQQLTAVENRTYLWVTLTLDVLENIPGFTKGNIRRVVRDLPTTVDSAYEKILNRSPDKDKAKTLLHIITAAMRPLSLEEVSLALAIDAGHQSLAAIHEDMEPKDRFRKTLRDLCGLLVVVIDDKVYLLHQTVKEFLVRNNSSTANKDASKGTRWKHSLLPKDSNRILADICTSYITVDRDQICQEGPFDDYDEYSACFWSAHFRQAGVLDGDPLIIRAGRICDPSSHLYQAWATLYDKTSRKGRLPRGATTALLASALGLVGVVKLLLATGKVDINLRDSEYGRTALSWAVQNGDEAVVRLLLATEKVDINSIASDGRTALSLAAQNGHEAVVNLLLATEKVDINSKDSYGRTALSLAAYHGHEAVIKLLLTTEEADINYKDSRYGRTALSLAAYHGHEAVMELLEKC